MDIRQVDPAPGVAPRDSTLALLARVVARREVLWAVTKIELRKRYAGSILGLVWLPLQAALLLAMYSFVYGVVFAGNAVGAFRGFGYVVFIFSGLLPYLVLNDALSYAVGSVRQNISLVKNTVFPVELIPLKAALAASAGHAGTLGVVAVLVAAAGHAGWHWVYLPVPVAMTLALVVGLSWILAATAVAVPDLGQLVNLGLLLALFLSPIAYTVDTVSGGARIVVYANPLAYLIEEFRFALLGFRTMPWWTAPLTASLSLAVLFAGAGFFRRFVPVIVDSE